MMFPPNSPFINSITFLFFPLGNGLSNSVLSNLVSTSSATFLQIPFVFMHTMKPLVLYNHTKTHTLISYLILVLRVYS